MSKSRAGTAFEISSGDDMILPERHPACRRREPQPGTRAERVNLRFDGKGKATSGSHREGESTDAERRGGAARSSVEGPVMGLERSEQPTRLEVWQGASPCTVNCLYSDG
jgi:hypothetical protein